MLYEIVGIARSAGSHGTADAQELCRMIGRLIVNNRGVIRQLTNAGVKPLPRIINKSRQSHIVGAHFHLTFDSSPSVQNEVFRTLKQDPRIIRSTIVKLGGKG